MAVPQGEGIGVHHDGSDAPAPVRLFFQPFQILPEAVRLPFHEDDETLHAGDLMEAHVPEEFGGAAFRIEEEMDVAPFVLILHQVGHDLVHQRLALMLGTDGHAAQGIAEAAARGDGFVVFVEHDAGIVQMRVEADALLLEQGFHLGQGPFVAGVDRADLIV